MRKPWRTECPYCLGEWEPRTDECLRCGVRETAVQVAWRNLAREVEKAMRLDQIARWLNDRTRGKP